MFAAGLMLGGCGEVSNAEYNKNGRSDDECMVKSNNPENQDAMPLYYPGAVEKACAMTPDESVTCMVVDLNNKLIEVVNTHCQEKFIYEGNGNNSGSVFEQKMDQVYSSSEGTGVCRMGKIENFNGCY